jgi:hypothetical protein
MNPEPQDTEKNFTRDLKAFERLPAPTKELHVLAEKAEKTTGKERAVLQRLIEKKSK